MIMISDPKNNKPRQAQTGAFLELAFRPFFLLASLFSILSLLLWNGFFTGDVTLHVYGGPLWWHMHEMLFGFVAAIIIGFLLTAVQTWTKIRSLNSTGLLLLVAVWMIARGLFLLPNSVPHWLIALLDIAFLPLATAALAYPIIKARLWRNLIFIPILLLMSIANISMHSKVVTPLEPFIDNSSTLMVLLVTLVMSIMGGRVFPMFTANGTQTARVEPIAYLEKVVIGSTLLALISSLPFIKLPSTLSAAIFFIASAAHAVRVFRWKIWVTIKTPLVWSLHISYWCIALGLFIYGLSEVSTMVNHSQAIHTLTVGAMATMILSMISRVSLGHTGRKIEVGRIMTFGLIAIILCFVTRVFLGYFLSDYRYVISIAVGFWVIGYGCFVTLYFPILSKPRQA
ncbi:NnrS family protein [Agarivorans sp. Z349TD_8]|uniref:NnrS family protein n=1 Tax=Agarivorans sp. Z349TD_8 TaxID=3421434 RepID=UPI003D7E7C5E